MFFKYYLTAVHEQKDEGDGRILLGDNTGGTAIILKMIRLLCTGVLISTEFPFIVDHTHTRF
jgi:hypothetical protein